MFWIQYSTSFKLLFQNFPVGTIFVWGGLEIGEEEFGDEEEFLDDE